MFCGGTKKDGGLVNSKSGPKATNSDRTRHCSRLPTAPVASSLRFRQRLSLVVVLRRAAWWAGKSVQIEKESWLEVSDDEAEHKNVVALWRSGW